MPHASVRPRIVVEAKIRLFEIPVVTLARIKHNDISQAVALFDR